MPSNVIHQFVATVVDENPAHRTFIERAVAHLSDADASDLIDYLAYCESQSLDLAAVASAYNTLVTDTQEAQIDFRRSGHYRFRTFEEAKTAVYLNGDYMEKYMYGLAVSSFLWPNHNRMHHFFLQQLGRVDRGSYLEIGPGHGYYFMRAAESGLFHNLVGVDISPTSIDISRSILNYFKIFDRRELSIELVEADFLNSDVDPVDCTMIVMGEVLEHVEEPERFLSRLRSMSQPKTLVYLTTCINAPAIDHIYLFETTDEVDRMIVDAGFAIDDFLFIPYFGQTLEQSLQQRLAINVCYVLNAA